MTLALSSSNLVKMVTFDIVKGRFCDNRLSGVVGKQVVVDAEIHQGFVKLCLQIS